MRALVLRRASVYLTGLVARGRLRRRIGGRMNVRGRRRGRSRRRRLALVAPLSDEQPWRFARQISEQGGGSE